MKCHTKNNDDKTVCYASKCAIKHGFDDTKGECFSCPDGCDYCKKTSNGIVCQKCSEKFAPKYSNNNVIETCESCSIWDCDFCEVISGSVKCRRSPCASKQSNSSNRKFSFARNDCSGTCPSDLQCAPGMINDENQVCFCRSCPAGSAVILKGLNAGVCKSCGPDCEKCELTSANDDVECKTCKGAKQWIIVETGSPATSVQGCFGRNFFKYKF